MVKPLQIQRQQAMSKEDVPMRARGGAVNLGGKQKKQKSAGNNNTDRAAAALLKRSIQPDASGQPGQGMPLMALPQPGAVPGMIGGGKLPLERSGNGASAGSPPDKSNGPGQALPKRGAGKDGGKDKEKSYRDPGATGAPGQAIPGGVFAGTPVGPTTPSRPAAGPKAGPKKAKGGKAGAASPGSEAGRSEGRVPGYKKGGRVRFKVKEGKEGSPEEEASESAAEAKAEGDQPGYKKGGKHFIQGAIKHPGALHEELGVPKGKKIPAGELAAAAKKGGKIGQRARFAQTLEGLHK